MTSTIPGRTALHLLGLLRALEEVERVAGTAFLHRMIELVDKPWLVKRH